jgi:hypothetical protein
LGDDNDAISDRESVGGEQIQGRGAVDETYIEMLCNESELLAKARLSARACDNQLVAHPRESVTACWDQVDSIPDSGDHDVRDRQV